MKKIPKKNLIIIASICFVCSIILFISASYSYTDGQLPTPISDDGNVTYELCKKDGTCMPEGRVYVGREVGNIQNHLDYTATYDSEISYDYDYYVKGKIVYKDGNGNVVHEEEEMLNDSQKVTGTGTSFQIQSEVTVTYSDYYEKANNSLSSHGGVTADLEISLVLKKLDMEEVVATVRYPLKEDMFTVTKEVVSRRVGQEEKK